MKEQDVIDNYFDLSIFMLKVAAVWVPEKTAPLQKRVFHFVYNTWWLVYCVLIYQPAESGVLFETWNYLVFIRCLRDQFNHIICLYKLYRWFDKREEIIYVMNTLQNKQFRYEDYEGLKQNEIFKKHKSDADIWGRIFLLGVNFICLSMFFSVFYVFIFDFESQYEETEDGTFIYKQILPASLKLPYKITTRTTFICTFIFEVLALDIYGWMIVGLDTLFISLMSCVSAHLSILQEAFKTIRPRCLNKLRLSYTTEVLHDSDELNEAMMLEMKKCNQHLQLIIDLSEKLESIYNIQTCGQVLTSLCEMCFCLFLLSNSFLENVGPEFTYLFSTSFELLMYCWFGNSITEASIAIPDAIFDGDWMSASKSFKKNMLITMTRMKKPIHITIAKFTPLAFTTFLSIARVAYSFFTVLRSDTFN